MLLIWEAEIYFPTPPAVEKETLQLDPAIATSAAAAVLAWVMRSWRGMHTPPMTTRPLLSPSAQQRIISEEGEKQKVLFMKHEVHFAEAPLQLPILLRNLLRSRKLMIH